MSYQAAVECARAMGRVRQFELAKRLGIDWRLAVAYLARMEREGVVGRMDGRGWFEVIGSPRRSVSDAQSPSRVARPGGMDKRFEALRRLIARELHPDISGSTDIHDSAKSELFKRIWPQVENISRLPA